MKVYKQYQEGLIKSLLARPDELKNIVNVVDSNDFEDVNYKLVYEALLDLFLKKEPVSLAGVLHKIDELGGKVEPTWILSLDGNVVRFVQAAPPMTWAKLLKKESAKHKAHRVLKEGLENLAENDPLHVMGTISDNLNKVALETSINEGFDIRDSVKNFKKETKTMLDTGGQVASINSAYPTIDYYTQGWGCTHMITIGARTGVGKSVFAINNAVAAMAQEKSVLFFSLEMTEREVISRMVASIAMIPIQKIEKALPLTPDEIQRQSEALEFIADSKLEIDTNPLVTIEHIKRTAIKQSQSEKGLDFIIIDYLQLIANAGKSSRQEAVADVSRNIKILAKELNVPIMVLVQLNREKRGDEEDQSPKIYDIRESGAIAQDSNVVILIDRDTSEDEEVIDPKAVFIIAKNRQGEANKYITVRTRLEASLFIDDNIKGQEMINDLETQVNENGDYEQVFTPEAANNFEGGFGECEGIDEEAFSGLFDDDEFEQPF